MNGRGTVTLFHTSFQGSCRHRRIYHSIPILLCGKLGICPLRRNCLLNSHKLWRLYRFTKISSSFSSFRFYFIFLKNAHKHTHEHFPPPHLSQDCFIQKASNQRDSSSFWPHTALGVRSQLGLPFTFHHRPNGCSE